MRHAYKFHTEIANHMNFISNKLKLPDIQNTTVSSMKVDEKCASITHEVLVHAQLKNLLATNIHGRCCWSPLQFAQRLEMVRKQFQLAFSAISHAQKQQRPANRKKSVAKEHELQLRPSFIVINAYLQAYKQAHCIHKRVCCVCVCVCIHQRSYGKCEKFTLMGYNLVGNKKKNQRRKKN